MLYDTKYCWRHIAKPIPSIVGGILQSRYQVLLAAYCKADTKYCWRHIAKPIPSIVGGILQSRYQVLLAAYYKADTKYCYCRAKRRQVFYTFRLLNDHQQVTVTDF
jgi:hypothetical protein